MLLFIRYVYYSFYFSFLTLFKYLYYYTFLLSSRYQEQITVYIFVLFYQQFPFFNYADSGEVNILW